MDKRSLSVPAAVIGGIVVLVIGVALGGSTDIWNTALKTLGAKPNVPALDLSSVQTTYEQLAANYDGTLDKTKLIDGANHGLVSAIGDPYTVYFSKSEAEEFSGDLEGSFSGIGAELELKDAVPVVRSVLDNSPAKSSGVTPGDSVVGVNGTSTQGLSLEKVITLIRGKAGTTVKLALVRGDEARELTVTRADLTDPSVKSEVTDGIGIMRISRFGETDTASLARTAAQSFKDQGVKGVILDLRGNGGGYVDAAQDIADLWLDNDVIVTQKKGDDVTDKRVSSNNAILNGVPTIVLIDGGSASASEIVAGALHDNGAATLLGQKSYGKGVVQDVLQLSGGNELKVTVAKWYTPKGTNINKTGINPDTVVTPTDAQTAAGEDVVKSAALAKLAN